MDQPRIIRGTAPAEDWLAMRPESTDGADAQVAAQVRPPRPPAAVLRDLRAEIRSEHPDWPAQVIQAEVEDAARGIGEFATLRRELQYRSLRALRTARAIEASAARARRTIRFERLVQGISDRFSPRVAREWLRIVAGQRTRLNMPAIERALAQRDTQMLARLLDAGGLQKRLEDGLTSSFRAAMDAAGRESAAMLQHKGVAITFDASRPDVAAWARRNAATLVKDVPQQVRRIIAEVIAMGSERGLTVVQQARAIREVVGLPPNWSTAPMRLADEIRNGEASAATSRYMSAVDKQRIRSRIAADTVDESFVEEMQAKYAAGLRNVRALTIARTETQRAAHAGLAESWSQGVAQGALPRTLRRFWIVTPDERLCRICRAIPRMNRKGRKLDEPFATPEGPVMYPPSPHPKCRCSVGLAFPNTWPAP